MQKYNSYKDSGVQWIGEIPDHWEVMKLKYILRAEKYACKTGPFGTQLKGNDLQPEGDVRVYNQRNVIDDNFESVNFYVTNQKAESLDSFYTQANDLLVTSRGTIGRCSILPNDVPMGILHPCLIALRIDESKCLTKWLKLFINESDAFATNIFLNSNATTIEVIYTDTIKNVDVTIPSISDQQKLLDYLDSKCSKIDNVIATQEKRVELLRELKQSIITRAVTRGINPDAKMKDSGVEWIGEIPEHWGISTLKHYASFHNGDRSSNYPSGDDLKDSGVIFVTSNNIHNITLESENVESKYITPEKYNSLGGAKLRINDIIYCLRGSIGNCAINKSHSEGTVASSLVAIRAHHFVADYLNYLLHSEAIRHQVNVTMNGSCAANLSAEVVSRYYIPIPPISEQKQIVTYIEQQTSRIDSSIAKALRQIELLKEYKQSLITEVVTGKRKVV